MKIWSRDVHFYYYFHLRTSERMCAYDFVGGILTSLNHTNQMVMHVPYTYHMMCTAVLILLYFTLFVCRFCTVTVTLHKLHITLHTLARSVHGWHTPSYASKRKRRKKNVRATFVRERQAAKQSLASTTTSSSSNYTHWAMCTSVVCEWVLISLNGTVDELTSQIVYLLLVPLIWFF